MPLAAFFKKGGEPKSAATKHQGHAFLKANVKLVQAHLEIPFLSSSLLQLPAMVASMPAGKRGGVINANGPLLKTSADQRAHVHFTNGIGSSQITYRSTETFSDVQGIHPSPARPSVIVAAQE
ncbi:hypothetical protein [Tropicimonas marinistellae]|uniref:hypothetical protein n=1 Tax=Tropicimonas marinistellae TaxID=1739787 RepID=UPI000829BDCF|nr:hypothetical protein [Tropicimonas marinistellae]